MLDHGKGFERFADKAAVAADTLIRNTLGEAFFTVRQSVLYVGHTHHMETKAIVPHLELKRVNTFAHTSDYEERLCLGSDPFAMVYALDSEGRLEEEKRIRFTLPLDGQVVARYYTGTVPSAISAH